MDNQVQILIPFHLVQTYCKHFAVFYMHFAYIRMAPSKEKTFLQICGCNCIWLKVNTH